MCIVITRSKKEISKHKQKGIGQYKLAYQLTIHEGIKHFKVATLLHVIRHTLPKAINSSQG